MLLDGGILAFEFFVGKIDFVNRHREPFECSACIFLVKFFEFLYRFLKSLDADADGFLDYNLRLFPVFAVIILDVVEGFGYGFHIGQFSVVFLDFLVKVVFYLGAVLFPALLLGFERFSRFAFSRFKRSFLFLHFGQSRRDGRFLFGTFLFAGFEIRYFSLVFIFERVGCFLLFFVGFLFLIVLLFCFLGLCDPVFHGGALVFDVLALGVKVGILDGNALFILADIFAPDVY